MHFSASAIATIIHDDSESSKAFKMLITDEEAKDLKIWVIKKLEDMYVVAYIMRLILRRSWECADTFHSHSSDADSDVLADYVLALIRADTPEPDLRANAIENLEDFLKERLLSPVSRNFYACTIADNCA